MKLPILNLLFPFVWVSSVFAETHVTVSNFSLPDGPALPIANEEFSGFGLANGSWAVGRYTGDFDADKERPDRILANFDQNGSSGTFLEGAPGFINSTVTDAATSTDGSDRFTDPAQGGPWPIVVVIGYQPDLSSSFFVIMIETTEVWKPEPPLGQGEEHISLASFRKISLSGLVEFTGATGAFEPFNGRMALTLPPINNAGISLTSVTTLGATQGHGGLKIIIENLSGRSIPEAGWELPDGVRRISGSTKLNLDPGQYNVKFFPPGGSDPPLESSDVFVNTGTVVEYRFRFFEYNSNFIPPQLRVIKNAGSPTSLMWDSYEGEQYSIEFSPSLLPDTWSRIATGIEPAEGRFTSFEDGDMNRTQLDSGFYRVGVEDRGF